MSFRDSLKLGSTECTETAATMEILKQVWALEKTRASIEDIEKLNAAVGMTDDEALTLLSVARFYGDLPQIVTPDIEEFLKNFDSEQSEIGTLEDDFAASEERITIFESGIQKLTAKHLYFPYREAANKIFGNDPDENIDSAEA